MEPVIKHGNALLIRTDLVSVRPRLKSSALRNTVIANEKTKKIVGEALKDAFYKAQKAASEFGDLERPNEIIKTALNLGMTELADELTLMT